MIKIAAKPKKPVDQKPRPALTVRSVTPAQALKIGRQMDKIADAVPMVEAAAGDGPKFIPVTMSLDQPLIDKLEDWAHSKRLNRSAALRVLLSEALAK